MKYQLTHYLVINHKDFLSNNYDNYIAKTKKFKDAENFQKYLNGIGIESTIVEEVEETRYSSNILGGK